MSVKLSAWVWDGCANEGIKGNKLLIMARLADYSSDEGIAYPGIETIARQIGAGRSTVITLIGELQRDGWLTKTERRQGQRNTSNLYTLNIAKLRKAAESHYSDSPNSEPSKAERSGSECSVSERSDSGRTKSERTEKPKKVSSDSPKTGPDPSVNSKQDPSVKKPCQVRAEPDETDPAKLVLKYFNEKTNSAYRDGKTTMGYIRGRLAEPEYVADDLLLVVDYLTAKWLEDSKMCDYLRPKTIFGPENFPDYLEKAGQWQRKGRPACVNGKWVKEPERTMPTDFAGMDYSATLPGFRTN